MDVDFDRKWEHYDTVRTERGLRAVWSLYEVESLYDEHPFGDGIEIVYTDHWGDKTIVAVAEVNGRTWLDLYVAADECIRKSGDNHHIYIEQLIPSSITAKILFLTTGS